MTLGNSVNTVIIVRQRELGEPHGLHIILTLEQTNYSSINFSVAVLKNQNSTC